MTTNIGTVSASTSRFLPLLRQSLSAHAIFLIPIAFYCMAYEVMHMLHPEMGAPHLLTGVGLAFLFFIPVLLLGLSLVTFYHVAVYVKPQSPARGMIAEYKKFFTDPSRMAHGLPALFIVSVMAFIFSDVQSNILTLQPSTWDVTFANWDKALHFGKQPWEWLQPVLGYAPITFLINLNYNSWFFSMMVLLIFFGFATKASELRTRFFLTYVSIWIISGNILAVAFASAGPCYYSRLGLSPDPYAGLMDYLKHVNETIPVWAVSLQDTLWQGHLAGYEGSVVSAMPSLHNGSALLFALAGYQISKFWGRILAAHAALIYVGSIHLAWHYAIDSYLAWTVTLVVWFASAPIARWWHATQAQRTFSVTLINT
jgi:PAP2 superfamily